MVRVHTENGLQEVAGQEYGEFSVHLPLSEPKKEKGYVVSFRGYLFRSGFPEAEAHEFADLARKGCDEYWTYGQWRGEASLLGKVSEAASLFDPGEWVLLLDALAYAVARSNWLLKGGPKP